MKKLIAIAVVFALAVGGVFAADLGGHVIGSVVLFQGDNVEDSEIQSQGLFSRWRIEGAGENDDGTFGAWLRFDRAWYGDDFGFNAIAWWKPIDQFKLAIGGNPDGIYGKEGYAGWMFHQIVADNKVVNASQAWGCEYTLNAVFRDAFFGGFGDNGLMLEIKPVDMFGLNLVIPIWGRGWGGGQTPFGYQYGDPEEDPDNAWWYDDYRTSTFFKNMIIQADLNLDFGNIALTFNMESWTDESKWTADDYKPNNKIGGRLHLYFGLTAIENLSLDIGVGFGLPKSTEEDLGFGIKAKYSQMDPLAFGVAAKFNVNDAFGIKARVLAEFMGSTTAEAGGISVKTSTPFEMIFEVLPFFAINDSVTIYADIGMNFVGAPDYPGAESTLGWHFNPYVGVGQEWGPTFFAGFKLWADGSKVDADKSAMNWAVPIALNVSF